MAQKPSLNRAQTLGQKPPLTRPSTLVRTSTQGEIINQNQMVEVDLNELHININTILKDNYLTEIQDLSSWKFHWRKLGNGADFASKIFVSAGSIVAYTESYFQTGYLALIAGSLGTLALVSRQFALYAHGQSQNRELNLRNVLTEGYRFLTCFVKNPLALEVQSRPNNLETDEDQIPSFTQQPSFMNKPQPNSSSQMTTSCPVMFSSATLSPSATMPTLSKQEHVPSVELGNANIAIYRAETQTDGV